MARSHKPNKRRQKAKPYLGAATICERVLHEDKVPSLIRVIDTFKIEAKASTLPPGVIQFVIFVLLKAGDAVGKRKLHFVGTTPSGKNTFNETRDIELLGGPAGGATLAMNVSLVIAEVGVYWFDVSVNDDLMTRIPLKIEYVQLH